MERFSPVPIIFVASVVYTIAAAQNCHDWHCGDYEAWAVVAGAASAILTGGIIAFRGSGRTIPHSSLAIFLFIWWALGAGLGTFKGPFTGVGNGYYAAWIAFLFSLMYAYNVTEHRGSGHGAHEPLV